MTDTPTPLEPLDETVPTPPTDGTELATPSAPAFIIGSTLLGAQPATNGDGVR